MIEGFFSKHLSNCVILLPEILPLTPTTPSFYSSSCCQGQEAFEHIFTVTLTQYDHVHSNITVSNSITRHNESKQWHYLSPVTLTLKPVTHISYKRRHYERQQMSQSMQNIKRSKIGEKYSWHKDGFSNCVEACVCVWGVKIKTGGRFLSH